MPLYIIETKPSDTWQVMGQIVLPEYANARLTEHALLHLTVPIFAPRGDDVIKWNYKTGNAMIYDANKQPIVRLTKHNSLRVVK